MIKQNQKTHKLGLITSCCQGNEPMLLAQTDVSLWGGPRERAVKIDPTHKCELTFSQKLCQVICLRHLLEGQSQPPPPPRQVLSCLSLIGLECGQTQKQLTMYWN